MKFQFNIDLTDKDYTDFNVFCAAASVGFSAKSIISGTLLLIIPQAVSGQLGAGLSAARNLLWLRYKI